MYGHVTWQENVLTKLYLLLTWTLTLAVVGLGLTIKIDSKADSPKNYWFISVKHPILPPLQNHTSFNYLYKMSKKMTKNPCIQSDFTVNLVLTLAVSLPKTFCLMYQWNKIPCKLHQPFASVMKLIDSVDSEFSPDESLFNRTFVLFLKIGTFMFVFGFSILI